MNSGSADVMRAPGCTASIDNKLMCICRAPNTFWNIPRHNKLKYKQLFNQADANRYGYIAGDQVKQLLTRSRLSQSQLARIWLLADIDKDGKLTCDEFVLACHLRDIACSGQQLPKVVPLELIPPSYYCRKLTKNPHTNSPELGIGVGKVISVEDKKKANFALGRAYLENKRKSMVELNYDRDDEVTGSRCRSSTAVNNLNNSVSEIEDVQSKRGEMDELQLSMLTNIRVRTEIVMKQLKSKVSALQLDLEDTHATIANLKLKLTSWRTNIKSVNEEIIELNARYESRMAEQRDITSKICNLCDERRRFILEKNKIEEQRSKSIRAQEVKIAVLENREAALERVDSLRNATAFLDKSIKLNEIELLNKRKLLPVVSNSINNPICIGSTDGLIASNSKSDHLYVDNIVVEHEISSPNDVDTSVYEEYMGGSRLSDANVGSCAPDSKINDKRQLSILELIKTESLFQNDLQMILNFYYHPLESAKILSSQQLSSIFLNLNEVIHCSSNFLRAMHLRRSLSAGVVDCIGDVCLEQQPHMTPYIKFCSGQQHSFAVLQDALESEPLFRSFCDKCVERHAELHGLSLSSYLIKPMQRVTKYPLLLEKIHQLTPDDHPDKENLFLAQLQAQDLCGQVNEGVRASENQDRLRWLDRVVATDSLNETLYFNSVTNSMGHRKSLHSGLLIKSNSGKELITFLTNDFILFTVVSGTPSKSSHLKLFSAEVKSHYLKVYREPLLLSELKLDGGFNEEEFTLLTPSKTFTLRAAGQRELRGWLAAMREATGGFDERRSRTLRRQESIRGLRTGVVLGRLLLVLEEASSLVGCRRDGKSNPYSIVTIGTQEKRTSIEEGTLNPKFHCSMQFVIKDPGNEVLSITVYHRNRYSPDDFLGRCELAVAQVQSLLRSRIRGPVMHQLQLSEVIQGSVLVKLDLQMFDR